MLVASAGFAAQGLTVAGCETEDDCPAGSEACPCTADNLCLQGLVCLSSYCVNSNATPTTSVGSGNDGNDGSGFDNVAACDNWRDGISCGDVDISQFLDCNTYADTACDVAEFFDCLDEVSSCVDGVYDNSRWPECSDLTTCT
jgi:hypothetical protein